MFAKRLILTMVVCFGNDNEHHGSGHRQPEFPKAGNAREC